MKGRTPSKPPEGSEAFTCWGLDENIWSLMKECWSWDPSRRPTVGSASQRLPRPLLRLLKKGQDKDEIMTRSQFRNAMMEDREVEAPSVLINALTRVGNWIYISRVPFSLLVWSLDLHWTTFFGIIMPAHNISFITALYLYPILNFHSGKLSDDATSPTYCNTPPYL